jgi:SAM-dependent methyltransferase
MTETGRFDCAVKRLHRAYEVNDRCRLCSSKLPEERVLDLGETALANELKSTREESLAQDNYPLYLVQCESCGHVQLPVVVPAERLFPPDYPYESGTTATFRDHLWKQAKWLTTLVGGKPSRFLEVGSNDGTLLGYLKELGHDVLGVEPAADLALAADRRGTTTVCGFFGAELAEQVLYGSLGRPFDCVVANNVFAHIDDLGGCADGVARVLKPGGLFVFEVGYLPRVIEKGLLGVLYHEHLSVHHLAPLIPFLKARGLYVEHVREIDSQGGSLRVMARKPTDEDQARRWSMPFWQPGTVREQLRHDNVDPRELCNAKRRLQQKALAATQARLEGKRVCGYGAPAKLTTLLAATGIADDLECVFDDNPRKVGRFTPGTGIPIVSSSELAARKPDVLVLFSANFESEIRAKHPDFAGEWVVL